jgi:hypothetical protein
LAKNSRLKREYNLTPAEVEDILKKQRNRCVICKCRLVKPHIDHCHKTGRVRGILCYQCNSGIGLFKDNPKILWAAADYLEARTQCWKVMWK